MLKSFCRMAFVLAVVASSASMANAGLLEKISLGQYVGYANNHPGNISGDLTLSANPFGGTPQDTLPETFSVTNGGLFKYQVQDTTASSPLTDPGNVAANYYNILVFCMEIPQNITIPSGNIGYSVYPLVDASNLGMGGAPLTNGGSHLSPAQVGFIQTLFDKYYQDPATMSDTAQAEFQLALWKLEYDTGANLNSFAVGNLKASDTGNQVVIDALAMVQAAIAGPVAHAWDVYTMLSTENQDQVFALPSSTTNGSPVPEPVSMIVWGVLGLAGIAFGRRKQA